MTAGRSIQSSSQDWCTPQKYVEAVRDFFGGVIDLDPCSNAHSIVQARTDYKLPLRDGLVEHWNYRRVYVNPPYGADRERGTTIKDWLRRCAETHEAYRSEVLALIPIAPNTRHWKDCVFGRASAICFLYDTRLRFLIAGFDVGKGAPMACGMVYWGKRVERFTRIFSPHGAVVNISNLHGTEMGNGYKMKLNLYRT